MFRLRGSLIITHPYCELCSCSIKQENSYNLSGFSVREYSFNKYLTMTKYDCNITELPDIGVVVEEANTAAMHNS